MLNSTLTVASQELNRTSGVINKLNTDYQWMTAQLGVLKNMIDEGWVSIFTPNANNDVSRVGVGS